MITIDTNVVVRYLIKDDEIFVGRVSDSVTQHIKIVGLRLSPNPTYSLIRPTR